ncbi:hypothetical protein SLS55_000737 [Diplodia seriata]|uniref:Uncharacterized protein n=1 Tax=Diplodia seriata TaxID=420778 RepID=A0A1S8B4A9_9PEZI|nr:hypothetical protein BK809_0006526 [Diplodia seriata]
MSASINTPVQTIAFLGATGGCTLPVLERTLKAGHHATALVRNPAKLRTLLLDPARGVAADVLDRNLTIIAGDASDATAVRTLLTVPGKEKTLVNTIMSGVGSLPKLQWSLRRPVSLQQPGLCDTATRTVQDALRDLIAEGYRVRGTQGEDEGKPVMIAISTTGISRLQRDVPVLFVPLYHWFLCVPHEDKRNMEDRVVAAKEEGSLRDFIIVRPSLLLDGEAKGAQALRVGWEGVKTSDQAPGPAVGYTTTRNEVAAWIWEEAIMNREKWAGKCVSLTY